jgi:predicted  nucleic acid-binding Zn-ribbon protein
MAGTLTSDTLQDGAGNSTATTNAIKGSAKAWVYWNSSVAIQKSYNVSSVTLVSAGLYTINFTTALADTNFAMVGSATSGYYVMDYSYITARTTYSITVASYAIGSGYLTLACSVIIID